MEFKMLEELEDVEALSFWSGLLIGLGIAATAVAIYGGAFAIGAVTAT